MSMPGSVDDLAEAIAGLADWDVDELGVGRAGGTVQSDGRTYCSGAGAYRTQELMSGILVQPRDLGLEPGTAI